MSMIGNFRLIASMKLMHGMLAGMPSILPEDLQTLLRLNEDIAARLQSISFFALVLIVSNLCVWGLWNYVARDSRWMPKLSFLKATSLVVLWGALFVVVLTMVSGARELLTPGAWKKTGFTHTLAAPDIETEHVSASPEESSTVTAIQGEQE